MRVVAALLLGAQLVQPAPAATTTVDSGNAVIQIDWPAVAADVGEAGLLQWVQTSAGIVSGYYGEFPTRSVRIRITVVDGARVMNGRTFGQPQAQIDVSVGKHTSAATLHDDWVLVHEMIHLAAPALADEHNWLAEGLATYVEGIARVQAGNVSDTAVWSEFLADMPKGLPMAGDQGLDRTHSWARTYWGGALFCLVADVRIRQQTGNRRGLQDALREIERAGGGMRAEWSASRMLGVGDRATGTTVLSDLYAAMKDRPYAPDLPPLWADLGIVAHSDSVLLDDTARLAATRRAITATR